MRVLLICQQSPQRYPIPAYDFWAGYFRKGLAEAGHEVLEVEGADWARGLLPLTRSERAAWKAEVWQRTIEAARREREGVDLVLSYLYPRQVEPAAIGQLRAAGAPCVNFFCDHLREYREAPVEFRPFDLHWVPEYAALAWYRRRGWPHLHAPMPCWVPPRLRGTPPTERPVASFIGSRDTLRADLLAAAARAGLPLEVRGAGWTDGAPALTPGRPAPSWGARIRDWRDFLRRQGLAAGGRRVFERSRPAPAFDFAPWVRPSPSPADYAAVLRESAVSLGVNRFPSFRFPAARPPSYSRLRDIEAPMHGACYLTEWTEGIDLLYEPDREIVLYRDAGELVARVRSLLADEPRRRSLRAAGQRRALAEHTVGRTVARIAAELGARA